MDFLIVGLIPGLGEVFDIVPAVYFYRVLGPVGLTGLVELIPIGVVDILPIWTVMGVYAAVKSK